MAEDNSKNSGAKEESAEKIVKETAENLIAAELQKQKENLEKQKSKTLKTGYNPIHTNVPTTGVLKKDTKYMKSEVVKPSGKLKKDIKYLKSEAIASSGKLKKDIKYMKSVPEPWHVTKSIEPYGDFGFRIELEGIDCGGFKNVDGIGAEIEEIEYQDGHELYPMKIPGRRKFKNIKLTKGYIASDTLWSWFEKTLAGEIQRKSGSIVLLNDAGTEVLRYNFFNAWPKNWNGFKFDGKGNNVLVEEIELVVERIEIKK